MMFFHRLPGSVAALLAAVVLALGLSGPVSAQAQEAENRSQSEERTEAEGAGPAGGGAVEARNRVRDLQNRISEIQRTTLENNPELEQQRTDLYGMVREEMKANGVDPETDMQRMQEVAQQLRTGELDQQEQQELVTEYEDMRRRFLEARQAAMSKESVRQAQEDFRQDMMAAMKAEEPEVEQLIQDYQKARADFQQEMRAAQGGGQEGGREGQGQEGQGGE